MRPLEEIEVDEAEYLDLERQGLIVPAEIAAEIEKHSAEDIAELTGKAVQDPKPAPEESPPTTSRPKNRRTTDPGEPPRNAREN